MNMIKTVADLKKALSVYDDALPIACYALGNAGRVDASLNNDTLICHCIKDGTSDTLEISFVLREPATA